MRRFLPLAFLLFAWPASGSAAPLCLPDTLDNYIGLGAAGCEFGGALFSNFSSAASPSGGTEINVADITVTPFDLGLDFSLTAAAAAGEFTGVLIGYQLSGPSLGTAGLSMTGTTVSPDGVAVALQDICVGGSFAPFPVCGGTAVSLIAVDDGIVPPFLTDDESFTGDTFFDVFIDLTLDSGLGGAAALDGTVRTAYRAGTPPVPEPSALLLLSSGLTAALARRRRVRH